MKHLLARRITKKSGSSRLDLNKFLKSFVTLAQTIWLLINGAVRPPNLMNYLGFKCLWLMLQSSLHLVFEYCTISTRISFL